MKKTTIRFQILIALNTLLAGFVLGFLAFDYRRELNERFEDKRISLEEEAKTLLPGVVRSGDDVGTVQQYIDTVCEQMQDSQSPGHHIAVRIGATSLQATAHHRASKDMWDAMTVAANSPRSYLGDGLNLIVGTHEQGDVAVYVSENVESLRSAVVRDEIRRLGGLTCFAILAALVVNAALLRIVVQPLNRLVATVRSIGRGELGTKAGTYKSRELSFLADEIDAMSESLAAADRDQTIQMAKARKIQRNLLPQDGTLSCLQLSHVYEPATQVAGDYFDVLDLGDACLVCIADVTGHGVPAAMSAAMLKTLLVQAVKVSSEPSSILAFINSSFVEVTLEDDFATMFLARFDAQQRNLQYASAGHESGWLLTTSGETHELASTGILLGIDPDASFPSQELAADAGDRLFVYTDGLPEAFNAQGECLGRAALAGILRATAGRSVEEASQHVRDTFDNHRKGNPMTDDLTFAVADFCPCRRDDLA